jgi:hypothetical protein
MPKDTTRVDRLLASAIHAIDSEDLAEADLQLKLLLADPEPLIADTLALADRALGDGLLELAVDHLHAAQMGVST